jgi:hypothetical protein
MKKQTKYLLVIITLFLLSIWGDKVFAQEQTPPSLEGQTIQSGKGSPFVVGWNFFKTETQNCSVKTVLDELQADGGSALEANELWLMVDGQWKKYQVDSSEASSTTIAFDQTLAFNANQKFFFDLPYQSCQTVDENRQKQIDQLRQGSQTGGKSFLEQLASIPLDFWRGILTTLGFSKPEEGVPENLPDLKAESVVVYKDLNVLGKSTVSDLGVTGQLNIGLLYLDDLEGSINALGTLKLQNQIGGPIDFLAGQAVLDTKGNLKIEGKLIAPNSTGQVKIKAGQTSVTVSAPLATPQSKIFLTPLTDLPSPLFIKSKGEGFFIVGVSKPPLSDLNFDWWIVN